jgi:DNA invertase Pin-like site-specific DNA recombinase
MPRVGIYARVSTADKDQDPDTQLLPLHEFAGAQGWTTAGEFVDHASATDIRGRAAWRELLQQAARRRVDVILVWKLDRAFRSVAHMATTVEQLRRWGVGLRSYSEPWLDTSGTSPVADLMLNILASFAQFERALIAERVRAGMARARKQGKRLGRPPALDGEWERVRPLVERGGMSQRQAARALGVGRSTVARARWPEMVADAERQKALSSKEIRTEQGWPETKSF